MFVSVFSSKTANVMLVVSQLQAVLRNLGKKIYMIFCFSGTGAFDFSPPLQNVYSQNRDHNFV